MTTRLTLTLGLLTLGLGHAVQASEFPANKLFVGSQGNDRVLMFGQKGNIAATLGVSSALSDPTGLAFGPGGLLYVLSAGSQDVQVFDADSDAPVFSFGATAGLTAPQGLAFGPRGQLFVGDGGSQSVFIFERDGSHVDTLGAGSGLGSPSGLAFSAQGHLYVTCSDSGSIFEFDQRGALVQTLGEGSDLVSAGGLAVRNDGALLVSSSTTDSVLVIAPTGEQVDTIGQGSILDDPGALCRGPDDNLYVVSRGTDKILAFDEDGDVARIIGKSKSLKTARALAFAPFRFKFNAKGALAADGTKVVGMKQPGILSISPGSQSIMLQLLKPNGSATGLDVVFGSDTLVMAGAEAYMPKQPKKRRFHGEWFSDDSTENGLGSLTMTVSGKPNKKGFFEIKGVKGLFMRAGEDGVFFGKGKSGKLIK